MPKARGWVLALVVLFTIAVDDSRAANSPSILPQDGRETWAFIGLNQAGEDWYLDTSHVLPLPDGLLAFTLKRGDANRQTKVLYSVDCASGLANAIDNPPKKPLAGSALENAVLRVCRTAKQASGRDATLRVEVIDGRPIAFVNGEIANGFAAKLKGLVRQQRVRVVVVLSSPGGSVGEALDAGQFLFENEISTLALGDCASACVYLFAGGIRRYASEDATFYLHRAKPTIGAGSSESGQALQALISEYLMDKGVSVAIANKAARVANADALAIGAPEALRYGLVHEIARP